MQPNFIFSIPHIDTLRSKDGWNRDSRDSDIYVAVRSHFLVRTRQVSPGPYWGNIVDSFSTTLGVSEEITRTIELNQECGLIHDSLQQFLREHSSLQKFVSELGVKLGKPVRLIALLVLE